MKLKEESIKTMAENYIGHFKPYSFTNEDITDILTTPWQYVLTFPNSREIEKDLISK